jgi:hypothetical protein
VRALILLALLGGGCGREDIELVPRAGDGGPWLSGDGGMCMAPSTPRACQGLGASCSVATECCSNRCVGHVCLQAGSCAAPGVSCATRGDCCSGRCEPTSAGALACTAYCAAPGAACTVALDCCAMDCHGGVCGGSLCLQEGDDCTVNADCCSNVCPSNEHKCALSAGCRPSGENCTSGGGAGCCSNTCNQSGRCDFGPGPCRPNGALCVLDSDCCRGTCVGSPDGNRVCTAACIGAGSGPCTLDNDCCAGLVCSGTPATCNPPASACKLLGQACANNGDCCSALCMGQWCGTICPINP